MSPSGRRLQDRVAVVREHLTRRTGIAIGLWALGGIGVLFVIAWIAVGVEWRQGSNVPAVLDGVAIGTLVLAIVVFRSLTRRWFGEVPLAASIERAAGIRSGVLRGALELSRATPHGVSGSLAGRAVDHTANDLEGRSTNELAGGLGDSVTVWTRRGMGVATAFALMLVALTVASPRRTAAVLAGVTSPISTMIDPVLPPLAMQPGDVEVLRGTDVELEISAAGRLGVTLQWQAAGDIARTRDLEVVDGRARHTFQTVSATIDYRVVDTEGNATRQFEIVPVDPLFVSDLVLEVTYPPHTGLPPDEYRGDPPPLRLPAGSTLQFEGRTSRPLSSVELLDSVGARVLDFQIDGSGFTSRWTPTVSGAFEWSFRDQMGGAAEIQPEPLEVTVVPDLPPVIAISMPGRDTVMPLNLRQPLVVEAADDYGLRRVELVAYRVTSFGEAQEPVEQGFDVGGQRGVLARPLLDLTRWGLLPGDTVHYFARAVDNSPPAQVTTSDEYVLRMPEVAELRREAEETFEDAADRLEQMAAEADRQATENRDRALESENKAGDQQGEQAQAGQEGEQAEAFEQREELERALDEQKALSAGVDSLQAQMDALERMMEEAGEADPELKRQLDELQDMLSQMTGDDLQRRMEQLSDALDQENMAEATKSLEDMAAEQDDFRERLEEALEKFRRAALEQDFRATTSEAEELARQEQALADAMKEGDDPQLRANQQQELARQADQLDESMQSLQERLDEIGESAAAEGVDRAREAASEARQQMQEAQQKANQGDTQAGEDAQDAAEKMQEVAEEMQDAMQEMAQEQFEKQQEALLRTADDALSLARRQDQLGKRMEGASQEDLASMRTQEASLLQGVQNIAENLQASSEGAMGQNRELSAQMGLAMESLQGTIEAMEGRRGSSAPATSQAEQAIQDLNQLALMAIAGAEQMGQQGQGQGAEDVAEQLQQLAQQQGDLMNQSTQLMPMQLGEQAMQQQMQQMSQGQQSVASDLGDLADDPGAEQSLGDLEELARQAQILAQQMAQGRLTPEMIQQQEQLFHRLLDAGRSLERDEYSEERESERPGDFERGAVLSLSADQLGVMQYEIPEGQLQQLSPAVRQLVLDYFQRLNRARGGGGS